MQTPFNGLGIEVRAILTVFACDCAGLSFFRPGIGILVPIAPQGRVYPGIMPRV